MDKTERLPFHFSLSCVGEGNGNPLQCSCLENLRDGGAWWAVICGVAQSQTRLKWLSRSSNLTLEDSFPLLTGPPPSVHSRSYRDRERMKFSLVTYFFLVFNGNCAASAKSLQLCLTLCDPIDGSPPGSPVPGILQARTLEWVAISFSNA